METLISQLLDNSMAIAVLLIPLLSALVQLVKVTVDIPTRYIPILTVFLGILLNLAVGIGLGEHNYAYHIFIGAVVGLSASGLYDNLKMKKRDENTDDLS